MEPFRHVDARATIIFGAGAIDAAADLIGDGFTLLTTERAAAAAPALADRANQVIHVPAGHVDEVAGELEVPENGRIVALGGGRVIDVAKAIAAADRLEAPIAIPTTLSGAEMTGSHRHAKGVRPETPRVRATVIVNDPALSASAPEELLAASSGNALGHATTAVVSTRSTPIARAVAHDAIRQLATGWKTVDRTAIALGALLSGWAVDRSGLGPHHAVSQTAVRVGGAAHADANAALLPHTIRLSRQRVPGVLDDAVVALAEQLRDRAGARLDGADVDAMTDAAARRDELDRVPPRWTADEVRALYAAAS